MTTGTSLMPGEPTTQPIPQGESPLDRIVDEACAKAAGKVTINCPTAPIQTPIAHFLEQVYTLELSGATRAASTYAFRKFDVWIAERKYSHCNIVLDMIDPNKLGVDLMMAFLSITRPARDVLPARNKFLAEAHKRISFLGGGALAQKLLRYMDD